MRTFSLAGFCLCVAQALGGPAAEPASERDARVENLRTFAKLYGYVRFFHPSDEASRIDWDRFAVLGARRVHDASSPQELQERLERLFLPIAPSLRIFPTGDPPKASSAPDETEKIVAWQHLGVSLGPASRVYRSVRLNRPNEIPAVGQSFGTALQTIDAAEYRGKQIKLRAFVRAEVAGSGNQGQLWLRVDRPNNVRGFFDNMGDRPIRTGQWQSYEIEGTVDSDAVRIAWGGLLTGFGQIWMDDVELLVRTTGRDQWTPAPIRNPGFEEAADGELPNGWFANSPGFAFRASPENPHRGTKSLQISRQRRYSSQALFKDAPSLGETIDKPIGGGLSCRIPLALPSESSDATASDESPRNLERLVTELDSMQPKTSAGDEAVRAGSIVIAWNVFQHFYPYFDVVDVNWDETLTWALGRALSDADGEAFIATLRELVARLEDGHGRVSHPDYNRRGQLPILIDWVENRVVVIHSEESSLVRGDVILSLDGVDADEVLAEEERYISGSPQWKRYRALLAFGMGDVGTAAKVVVQRGTAGPFELNLARIARKPIPEPRPEPIAQLEQGLFYIDLGRAEMAEIRKNIKALAAADGIVFDLRGYPNGNHDVIRHLLKEPDTSGAWMRIPRTIYPDRARLAGYTQVGWRLQPAQPRIQGKCVFLTDGRAISYAESFMSFIEHYRLAEIVGQPTAGANGNVNAFELPGGYRVAFTGMKVVKHDGSQHHLIGILPTIRATRTIQGITEGRDELLEKALAIIRDSK